MINYIKTRAKESISERMVKYKFKNHKQISMQSMPNHLKTVMKKKYKILNSILY